MTAVAAVSKGKAQLTSPNDDSVRLSKAINELMQGRSNAVGKFTLAAGASSTVVTAPNVGLGNIVIPFAATAHAAAATGLYILEADVIQGQFTVHHNNTADVDKTFFYVALG